MTRIAPLLFLVFSLSACGPEANSENASPQAAEPITIKYADQLVTFEPENGGRMASFTVRGHELLKTSRDENGWQWGSTVWTSPQAAWNWPPEATFDAGPFTVTAQTPNSVTLQSAVDEATGLQLTKVFTFVKSPKGLQLEADYRLYNRGKKTISRGIWENTRLPYGGEFAFIADSIRQDKLDLTFSERGEVTVVSMEEGDRGKGKLFIYPGNGKATFSGEKVRLRKLWYSSPADKVAPGQSPLEIFLSPTEGFAEFEVQGPYRKIAPGGYNKLVVNWRVGVLEYKD